MTTEYLPVKTNEKEKTNLIPNIENIEDIEYMERIFSLIKIVLILFDDINFDKNSNTFQVVYKNRRKTNYKKETLELVANYISKSKLVNNYNFMKLLNSVTHCRIEQITDKSFRIV